MGTLACLPETESGKPRRPVTGEREGGASVVVRARENRVQGEAGQRDDTPLKSEEWTVDTDHHTDRVWVLSVQRRLYQWSQKNPDEQYHELWGWITNIRNLRCAWRRIASNKGKRTPGVDGKTVRSICRNEGEATFLQRLRRDLRTGAYRHSPCRRKLIPKPGKPGEFRPLGIPTIADRIVQAAVKQFLKAGVLAEDQFVRTPAGTPQGGVISPLLANIALSVIEERYERWVNHRSKIRKNRKANGG